MNMRTAIIETLFLLAIFILVLCFAPAVISCTPVKTFDYMHKDAPVSGGPVNFIKHVEKLDTIIEEAETKNALLSQAEEEEGTEEESSRGPSYYI